MATGIRHIEFLDASFETGYGVPTHIQLKGSLFIDITEPNLYQNQNGFTTWDLISNGGGGTGGTSDSFSVFSANTGTVSATGPEQTVTYSGINVNILTDDITKTITFSAGTGGGGGAPSANTFVNSFIYDNANKLTITRNDAVSYDVNLDAFTGITINGDLTVTGDTYLANVTADTVTSTFYGDGSNLTGVSTSDTYVTGFTYDEANNFTIGLNDGVSLLINVNTFTGITVNGVLTVTGDTYLANVTADTITSTFYGDGSNLTGVSGEDNYVESGIYNSGTTSIDFSGTNSATTFSVDVSELANFNIVDIDRVNNNVTLIGYGIASACKIQRVNTQGGGYSSTWANGDAVTLDKVWSLRYTYTYF